jgi:hypothetical protein
MLDCNYKKGGSLVRKIFESFLPAMSQVVREKNQNIQWHYVFSGRYISDWENKILINNIPLTSYELKLFDPQSIAETIDNYVKEKNEKPDQEEVQRIASLTLYITGGHPKCMVPIIKDGLDRLMEDVIRNEKKYYEETILPVVEDIRTHISTVYNTAETLSPVRKITRTLLDKFIDNGIIQGFHSKFDIEEKLLSTFLYYRKGHFLEDAIIRKILAIHLRHSNAALFKQISERAIECYLEELKDPESLEPAMLTVELLFLELQFFRIDNHEKSDAKRYFEEKVNYTLEIIEEYRKKNALDIIEGVKKLFEKDSELRLNLQYLADAKVRSILDIINNKINQLRC